MINNVSTLETVKINDIESISKLIMAFKLMNFKSMVIKLMVIN